MLTFVAALHVLVSVTLVLLVLVQDSKGGAMGGMFAGGGSNSVLGATGATNLFVKMTRVAAILFAVTCILLVGLTSKQSSVIEDTVVPATAPAAAPAPDAQAPVDATAPAPEKK